MIDIKRYIKIDYKMMKRLEIEEAKDGYQPRWGSIFIAVDKRLAQPIVKDKNTSNLIVYRLMTDASSRGAKYL